MSRYTNNNKWPIRMIGIWGVAVVVFVVYISRATASDNGIDQNEVQLLADWLTAGGLLVFIGSIILPSMLDGSLFKPQHMIARRTFLHQFEAKDDASISTDLVQLPALLIAIGQSRKIIASFTGRVSGKTIHGIEYEYYDSFGHKPEDYESYTVLRLRTTLTLPYILISPAWWNYELSGYVSSANVGGLKTLRVEGTMNNYIDTSILPDEQIVTLSFMTPDLLDELFQIGNDVAIEFANHDVYFSIPMSSTPTVDESYASQLLQSVAAVIKHLKDIDDSWLSASTKAEVAAIGERAIEPRNAKIYQPD
jgi:hypothetical protein